jgi:hypothetical protein
MRPPSKKRPGNPILASDWNLLIDALEARTPRPGPGTEIISASGGFSFRVRATAASAAAAKPVPLHILSASPPYVAPVSPLPPESPLKRFYIEWGTLNDQLATNWDAHFDISQTTYFFAKATLRSTDDLQVESWEIVTGSSASSHVTASWPIGDSRPAEAVCLLGTVLFTDGKPTINNNGGGSLLLSEHITHVSPGSGYGDVRIGKQLSFIRLNY